MMPVMNAGKNEGINTRVCGWRGDGALDRPRGFRFAAAAR